MVLKQVALLLLVELVALVGVHQEILVQVAVQLGKVTLAVQGVVLVVTILLVAVVVLVLLVELAAVQLVELVAHMVAVVVDNHQHPDRLVRVAPVYLY